MVVFDPRRDLAVLSVPGLPAPALTQGPDLKRSDSGIVAGFPLDGPYRLAPARVRDVLQATGADIYGQVVGVVFAKSLDDDNTGYALTMDEARPVLDAAKRSSSAVSTGGCAAA